MYLHKEISYRNVSFTLFSTQFKYTYTHIGQSAPIKTITFKYMILCKHISVFVTIFVSDIDLKLHSNTRVVANLTVRFQFTAASLVTYAGERFDFVLSADQEKDLYWIRFRGLMDCDERFTKAYQMAVLEYKDLNITEDSSYPSGPIPNWDNSHREGIVS